MPGGSEVNVEGATLGVHAGGKHDVLEDVLLLKMVSVEDDLVVDDLTDKTERRLGEVCVNGWHVQIVHEEDQVATGRGSENLSRALVNIALQHDLK